MDTNNNGTTRVKVTGGGLVALAAFGPSFLLVLVSRHGLAQYGCPLPDTLVRSAWLDVLFRRGAAAVGTLCVDYVAGGLNSENSSRASKKLQLGFQDTHSQLGDTPRSIPHVKGERDVAANYLPAPDA